MRGPHEACTSPSTGRSPPKPRQIPPTVDCRTTHSLDFRAVMPRHGSSAKMTDGFRVKRPPRCCATGSGSSLAHSSQTGTDVREWALHMQRRSLHHRQDHQRHLPGIMAEIYFHSWPRTSAPRLWRLSSTCRIRRPQHNTPSMLAVGFTREPGRVCPRIAGTLFR
jgi:hypothetical protein